MVKKTNIVIVGSGIIGMTTALRLAQIGFQPIVVSKDQLAETTSAAAAAWWYPYKAEPVNRVSAWAEETLAVFKKQECIPSAGIAFHQFTEFLAPDAALPWWHTKVEGFKCDGLSATLSVGLSLCKINATLFCNIIPTLHDICTASVCMVSNEQKWPDFGYFFDRAGESNSRLVLAA